MSRIVLLLIYYISFVPLWIVVISRNIMNIVNNNENLITEYISTIFLGITILVSLSLVKKSICTVEKNPGTNYVLKKCEKNKIVTVETMMSYVLPLFIFDFSVWYNWIEFLVFFICIAIVIVRNNYFLMNIVLELMGYTVYNCEFALTHEKTLIKQVLTKKYLNLEIGELVNIVEINKEVSLIQSE